MPILSFDPSLGIIEVFALAADGLARPMRMALDTGATTTAICEDVARELGIDPDASPQRRELATASGLVRVPVITLPSLRALTYEQVQIPVICLPLPAASRVEGLLGSDFLWRFHIFINYRKGLLVVREAQGLLSRLRFWFEVFRSL